MACHTVACLAGWTVRYLVRWEGCDPETEEEWESTWLGPDTLTKDLLAEAREVERRRYGEVVGEKGRNARKREREEPRREENEVVRQAAARVRCEEERDEAAASRGKVVRRTPRVVAKRAADEAVVLAAQRAAAAAENVEVPMDYGCAWTRTKRAKGR